MRKLACAAAAVCLLGVSIPALAQPVQFKGFENRPRGQANLNVVNGVLEVSNIGPSGLDGVAMELGQYSDNLSRMKFVNPGTGSAVVRTVGVLNGQSNFSFAEMELEFGPNGITAAPDFNALGSPTYDIELYNRNTLVHAVYDDTDLAAFLAMDPNFEIILETWECNPDCLILLPDEEIDVLIGDETFQTVDRIVFTPVAQAIFPDELNRVVMRLSDVPILEITHQEMAMRRTFLNGIGPMGHVEASMECPQLNQSCIQVTNVGGGAGTSGTITRVPQSLVYAGYHRALASEIQHGESMTIMAFGNVDGTPMVPIAGHSLILDGAEIIMTQDFPIVGPNGPVDVELWLGDQLVQLIAVPNHANVDIRFPDMDMAYWDVAWYGEIAVDEGPALQAFGGNSAPLPGWVMPFHDPTPITVDGQTYVSDRIRIRATETFQSDVWSLDAVRITTDGIESYDIVDEFSMRSGVLFEGAPHSPAGNATLERNPGRVDVYDVGSSGSDGVAVVPLNPAIHSAVLDGLRLDGGNRTLRVETDINNGVAPKGSTFPSAGTVPVAVSLEGNGSSLDLVTDFASLGAPSAEVVVFDQGTPVGVFTEPSGVIAQILGDPTVEMVEYRGIGTETRVLFDRVVSVDPVSSMTLLGDELYISPSGSFDTSASEVRYLGENLGSFSIVGSTTDVGLPHVQSKPHLRVSPNPVLDGAKVYWQMGRSGWADVGVYGADGRLIRRLFQGASEPGQTMSATWDGRDGHGNRAVSGVYFVRIQGGKETASSKMILLD